MAKKQKRRRTNSNLQPRFDVKSRTLSLGPVIIKEFRVPAENQVLVLASFQEQKWRTLIDDPLPHKQGINPKKRLKDTIARLNHNQINALLKFHGNGEGQGIRGKMVNEPAVRLPSPRALTNSNGVAKMRATKGARRQN